MLFVALPNQSCHVNEAVAAASLLLLLLLLQVVC
jgi:hypothetical protein